MEECEMIGHEKYAMALDKLIDAKDEIARLRPALESAHALLAEWISTEVDSQSLFEMRARSRELLDR